MESEFAQLCNAARHYGWKVTLELVDDGFQTARRIEAGPRPWRRVLTLETEFGAFRSCEDEPGRGDLNAMASDVARLATMG